MSTPPELGDDLVDSIDTLSRRAVEASVVREFAPDRDAIDTALLVRVRDDEHLQPVDLEQYLSEPRRSRGTATISDPTDFALYANRLATLSSTCWADEGQRRITLVVNDHDSEAGDMGWRDHRAVLQIPVDPDWQAWTSQSNKLLEQEGFAEFLEDQAHTLRTPDAATMLEIATTIRAAKTGSFGRAIRPGDGSIRMHHEEETTASAGSGQTLEVPERFTIAVTPFYGGEPVEMTARFRLRINSGNLKIGFKLDRPDLVAHAAWEKVRGQVAEALGPVPVLLGTAPDPVTAASPTAHQPAVAESTVAHELHNLRQLVATAVGVRR